METTFVDLETTQPRDLALSELSADELAQVSGGLWGRVIGGFFAGLIGAMSTGATHSLLNRYAGRYCFP